LGSDALDLAKNPSAVNADSTVTPFGLLAYGDGAGAEAIFLFYIRGFHKLTTNLINRLIALHIIAALYHLIIVRDGVTGRMLISGKASSRRRAHPIGIYAFFFFAR
tara:strand:- start:43 stop:360 length:318 start_codon:yes stop_codon:yes gene_type:complete